ncbi:HpsJ family protein [Neosynechococcus sphagnicola]|uniref:HpsJ family protein n=1 Tax=Neosynechococcus sphagnicola TaxID=1501145 RepID=UPI000689CBF1|nr:HpsJ family protein [Neosynechococcus sphagnicola]
MLLQRFKADPKALDAYLTQQTQTIQTKIQEQIKTRQQQAEQQANLEAWKTKLRTSISSLFLAIGYILIGWTGLKWVGSEGRSSKSS